MYSSPTLNKEDTASITITATTKGLLRTLSKVCDEAMMKFHHRCLIRFLTHSFPMHAFCTP